MRAATVGRLEPRPEGWVEKSLGSFCDIYQPETVRKSICRRTATIRCSVLMGKSVVMTGTITRNHSSW